MSLFKDLKPFLQVARIFGFAPYSLNSVDLHLSRKGVIYSIFCAIAYTYLLYVRFQILASPDVDIKLRFLTILRTVLSECVIFVDIFVCIKFHDKLCASLELMQRYDQAVKLEATPNLITTRCWLVLGAIAIYFLSLGAFTYYYETWKPLESAIIYVVLYSSTTYGIVKFSAIAASLLRRFRHLNRLIKTGWSRRRLNLRDAWSLHGCLVAAAEELNSLYSAQLLLWIMGLTFNAISRIYVLCEIDGFINFKKVVREGGIAAVFVSLLTVLAAVCHMTAAEANKVGSIAFSADSMVASIQLMEATENLNSLYSAELLLWIVWTSFSLLKRLHMQWNQYVLNPIDIFMNVVGIIAHIIRLLLLAWFCHMTAAMANNVAAEAFRVNSRVLKMNRSWDDEDTFIIGQYFLLRRGFKITAGGGFLHVNLPLLRTIAAMILTYLVILRSPGEKRQGA